MHTIANNKCFDGETFILQPLDNVEPNICTLLGNQPPNPQHNNISFAEAFGGTKLCRSALVAEKLEVDASSPFVQLSACSIAPIFQPLEHLNQLAKDNMRK